MIAYNRIGEVMKYSEIAHKQVINIRNGDLIGLVNDLEFDPYSYQICAIYVAPPVSCIKKMFPWFFNRQEVQIDVKEIENITGDVILVRFS